MFTPQTKLKLAEQQKCFPKLQPPRPESPSQVSTSESFDAPPFWDRVKYENEPGKKKKSEGTDGEVEKKGDAKKREANQDGVGKNVV
jgi:hypothetical protein